MVLPSTATLKLRTPHQARHPALTDGYAFAL
jgi:hypothetical protein